MTGLVDVEDGDVVVMVALPRNTYNLLRDYAHGRGVNVTDVMQKLAYERARGLRTPHADVERLWRAGKTDKEIAESTGLTVHSIRGERRRGNLMPANRAERREVAVARMVREGKTKQQIAEEFGVTMNTIEAYYYAAKRAGEFK